MSKSRIYILQCLGVVMLLCGYLLRDRPDRLSMMHFDSASHSVIKKDHRSLHDIDRHQVHISSSHNSDKQKTNLPKHMPLEALVAVNTILLSEADQSGISHDKPLLHEYEYLFYEEINPPPPRC